LSDVRSLRLKSEVDFFNELRRWIGLVLSVFFVIVHLYAGFYGAPDSMMYRMLHLVLALAIVFVVFPIKPASGWRQVVNRTIDAALFLCAVWLAWYYLSTINSWEMRIVTVTGVDLFAAWMTLFLIFEAVRRVVGLIILGVALFFCIHALFANYFPGVFYGPPTNLIALLRTLLVGDDGVFGVPLLVMAQYVVLFIFFGQLLSVVGVGNFFLRLAFALFGHRTGGPAKAAVISSAFMGSLSGSAIGNVLTTGTFTIPLMRRLGYRGSFAGGVESAASTGGMIMPPVMGAIAFIMAEFIGRPYIEVALAAMIPALLYFLAIFVTVHLEARRLNLETIPRSALPSAWMVLKQQGYLLIPILLIIGTLLAGYSIIFVAMVAIVGTFVIGFSRRQSWPTSPKMLLAAEAAARSTVGLSATAASAGIIIGAIFATGLSFKLSQAALSAADGQLWLLVLISGLMALIMGMGMTASAVYITMVATVIPILRAAGVPEIAAHMFALYFGVVSNITPPVALAAFAAAPLAGADPMRTGVEAAKLGIAAFLIPVMFIYQPALVLEGNFWETILAVGSASIGLVSISAGFVGFLFAPLSIAWRSALLASGLLLVLPVGLPNSIGLIIFIIVSIWNWKSIEEKAVFIRKSEKNHNMKLRFFIKIAGSRMAKIRAEEGLEALPDKQSFKNSDLSNLEFENVENENSLPIKEEMTWQLWLLMGASACVIAVLGENLVHIRQPVMWLMVLFLVSLCFTAGVRLILSRVKF
jgi:TRAP transporter 4TM/12TM fusion protein